MALHNYDSYTFVQVLVNLHILYLCFAAHVELFLARVNLSFKPFSYS